MWRQNALVAAALLLTATMPAALGSPSILELFRPADASTSTTTNCRGYQFEVAHWLHISRICTYGNKKGIMLAELEDNGSGGWRISDNFVTGNLTTGNIPDSSFTQCANVSFEAGPGKNYTALFQAEQGSSTYNRSSSAQTFALELGNVTLRAPLGMSSCNAGDDVTEASIKAIFGWVYESIFDECGVLNGDNSTCLGCDGGVNSGLVFDGCYVCGGDNSSCTGCDGILNSTLRTDICDVCGGDNTTCTVDCGLTVDEVAADEGSVAVTWNEFGAGNEYEIGLGLSATELQQPSVRAFTALAGSAFTTQVEDIPADDFLAGFYVYVRDSATSTVCVAENRTVGSVSNVVDAGNVSEDINTPVSTFSSDVKTSVRIPASTISSLREQGQTSIQITAAMLSSNTTSTAVNSVTTTRPANLAVEGILVLNVTGLHGSICGSPILVTLNASALAALTETEKASVQMNYFDTEKDQWVSMQTACPQQFQSTQFSPDHQSATMWVGHLSLLAASYNPDPPPSTHIGLIIGILATAMTLTAAAVIYYYKKVKEEQRVGTADANAGFDIEKPRISSNAVAPAVVIDAPKESSNKPGSNAKADETMQGESQKNRSQHVAVEGAESSTKEDEKHIASVADTGGAGTAQPSGQENEEKTTVSEEQDSNGDPTAGKPAPETQEDGQAKSAEDAKVEPSEKCDSQKKANPEDSATTQKGESGSSKEQTQT